VTVTILGLGTAQVWWLTLRHDGRCALVPGQQTVVAREAESTRRRQSNDEERLFLLRRHHADCNLSKGSIISTA
jgi:hypothetical protein